MSTRLTLTVLYLNLVLACAPALALPAPAAEATGALGLGGVQGVPGADDEAGLGSRSAQVVPALRVMQPPIVAAASPAGELRLWMERFPDMRVPIGTVGRLNAVASRPGYLMLWTMDATGAVFAIADGITEGRGIVPVGPDRVATLPSDQQNFEVAICPPAGNALWFALHSDTPIPEAARQRLARELSGARITEADGAARFRAVVESVVATTPGWAARSHTMNYEVLPGPTDSRCVLTAGSAPPTSSVSASPPASPAPAPAPPSLPAPAPQPALPGLAPSAQPITVRLNQKDFRAEADLMQVEVRAPVACPSLTVLALGAGGAVDVLLPNARPLAGTPAAHETVAVPPTGSGIQFRVRVPPVPGVVERVVALCDTGAGKPLFQRRETDGPTTTLLPPEPEFAALVRNIDEAEGAGRLLVGIASYNNLGQR